MPYQHPSVARLPQQPCTILVVDGEENPRRILCRKLRALGYGVREAGNGRDALQVVHQYPGDIALVLLDVMLPELSGVQVAEHLLAGHRSPAVLFVSDYARSEVVRLLGALPPLPFIQRPVTTEALYRAVREALAPVILA